MGPNGAGKSTLGYTLGGRPGYEVTGGSGHNSTGQDLLALAPHERAAAGLFLGFQYPVEIPWRVLRPVPARVRSMPSARRVGKEPLSGGRVSEAGARAGGVAARWIMDMLKRPVNVGFSGGEKKRAEMVQMGILGSEAGDPRRDRQRARHRCAAQSAVRGSMRSCASRTRRCC